MPDFTNRYIIMPGLTNRYIIMTGFTNRYIIMTGGERASDTGHKADNYTMCAKGLLCNLLDTPLVS